MTNYVVPAPAQPAIAAEGETAMFPVRRIWCIGRNYAEHAREMGSDPVRESPFFFAKPADAVNAGGALPFPPATKDFHYEVELAVAIGVAGSNIAEADALSHVYGYAVALDMTRRDLQAEAKKAGRPWELAKGFDHSCPISPIVPVAQMGHPGNAALTLSLNGEPRQSAHLADMIWSVPEAIAYLSRFVALAPGDLILTGTPAGVGPVSPGDQIHGICEGIGEIRAVFR